ncbi:MAG: ATP-binding protein [Kiritimatiellae bacterium]|nr:ATP-binding protein [Kiritimatiellia bacterium]
MKPTNPFIVRGYRGPEYFCDRKKETRKVVSALTNERNVTLMAPRRYGKTGLVRNIFHHLPQDVIPVYVDIYSTTNLQEFTQMFAAAVLGALDTVADKAFAAIGRFFRAVRPTATPDGLGGVTFSFSVEKAHVETTLKGAFDYLASKEKRVVVAIDEFQQILEYPEKGTEALLRSYIQFLENANFIFAGSRHHLMGEMFTSPRRPFYQSTDILSLDVIPVDAYSPFAEKFFTDAKRAFSPEVFSRLYHRFEGVTWYVQSVLNRIWSEGGGLESDRDVEDAVDGLVEDRAMTFHDLMESQTDVRRTLLKAIAAEGTVSEITAGAFLSRHGLVAPSSVRAALPGLIEHDLVYRTQSGYIVYDYLLAEYLRRIGDATCRPLL